MQIYSSDNATDSVGVSPQQIDPELEREKGLLSEPFGGVVYLENMNRNPLENASLSTDSNFESKEVQLAIKRIKLALIALDDGSSSFNLTSPELFDLQSGEYTISLKNAVEEFQSFSNLSADGIFGINTLRMLDKLLFLADANRSVYDDETGDALAYIGQRLGTDIRLEQTKNENDEYVYTLYSGKNSEESIPILSNAPLDAEPIILQSGDVELLDRIAILSSEEIRTKLDSTRNVYWIEREATNMRPIPSLPAQPITTATLSMEVDNSPPKLLSDAQAKKYLVQAGDEFSEIVVDNYYSKAFIINNPYGENDPTIFSSGINNPGPVNERHNDAKFQFYLNLLYYYNTKEGSNGSISEYGMIANTNYQRFDPNNLNDYYLFDNAYDASEPQSVLPNYYRFLKTQEANGTAIHFDNAGKTNTFLPDAGKYIYIPSKRFADTLYYHLNFRHYEMLYTPQGEDQPIFVDDISNFIQQIQNTSFSEFTSWLKAETIELFQNIHQMFQSGYTYLIETFTEYWPRGLGGLTNIDVGVTWAIPISTDLAGKNMMWRKMGKEKELTIMLKQEASIAVGLDVGVGGYVGFNLGKGKRKPKTGFALGAGVQAEEKATFNFEYEFPIRPNETGLIAAFIAAIPSAHIKIAAELLDIFNVFNFSPRHYITKMGMGLSGRVNAWGAAQFSVNNGNANDSKLITKTTPAESPATQDREKSYLGFDNILDKIKGVGISIDGEIILGSETIYKAEYDQKALIPDVDARVPLKVSVETHYTVRGTLATGFIGSILQRFFLSATPISTILSFLNFDGGLAFSIIYEYDRGAINPRDLTNADVDISGLTNSGNAVIDVDGKMKYTGTGWTSYFEFGSFSGHADEICQKGTECMVRIDTYKLYALIKNATTFDATLTNVVEIFKSFSFRFKLGIDENTFKKNKIATAFVNKYLSAGGGNSVERVTKKEFIKRGKKRYLNSKPIIELTFGMALDIQLEFVVGDILPVLEYYVKRHYILLNVVDPSGNKERMNSYKNGILRDYPSIMNSNMYNSLYSDLNVYLDTEYSSVLIDATFEKQLLAYLLIFKDFQTYLESPIANEDTPRKAETDEPNNEFIDLGIKDILKAIMDIAGMLNTTVALEAKMGLEASAAFKLALLKATIRIAIGGEIAFMDHTLFMEKGQLWEFDSDDPLYKPYSKIKEYLNINSHGDGSIRKSIERKNSLK